MMIRVIESDFPTLQFPTRAAALTHIEDRASDIWEALVDPNFPPAHGFPGLEWDGDQATLWCEAPAILHHWRIVDRDAPPEGEPADDLYSAAELETRARFANLFALFWMVPRLGSCS